MTQDRHLGRRLSLALVVEELGDGVTAGTVKDAAAAEIVAAARVVKAGNPTYSRPIRRPPAASA
jgi:hypothetical protein